MSDHMFHLLLCDGFSGLSPLMRALSEHMCLSVSRIWWRHSAGLWCLSDTFCNYSWNFLVLRYRDEIRQQQVFTFLRTQRHVITSEDENARSNVARVVIDFCHNKMPVYWYGLPFWRFWALTINKRQSWNGSMFTNTAKPTTNVDKNVSIISQDLEWLSTSTVQPFRVGSLRRRYHACINGNEDIEYSFCKL